MERDSQTAVLAEHWSRARGGVGSLVLVSAESGGGKTALVEEFARSIGGHAPVLWGSCDPLMTPRPLGPILDMRHLLGTTVRGLLEGTGQAYQIYLAVHEFLRTKPCMLVMDDLHWADQGTVDLLRFLLRRVATTSALIVGTLRPDEVGSAHPLRTLLGDAARSHDSVSVDLPPLSSSGVRLLLGDREMDPERLHSLTGGNPFFVNQMLDHDKGEVPSTVRDAILARTVDLDEAGRDLLELLVCAPEAIPDHLLPQLGIGVSGLRSLNQAGLIRRSPGGIAFRHDLCRLAIAGSLPPGGESALHRRMLEALEKADSTDLAVLVHHANGAQDPVKILEYASSAGVEATRTGAHTQASEFFALALKHSDGTSLVTRAELLERLATEEYLLDRLDNAILACRRAIRLREQAGDKEGLSRDFQSLSVYEWYDAQRLDADRHASDAVAVLGSQGDEAVLGGALAWQAYLALHTADLATAQRLLKRARELAERVDDPSLRVRVELFDAVRRVTAGDAEGREAVLRIVAPAADSFDETYSSGYSNLAYLDVEYRRLTQAHDVLRASLPLAVEWDLPICHVWQLGARGRLRMMQGDWDAAEDDAERVLAVQSAPLARTWPLLVRGLVMMRRECGGSADVDEAWALAERLGEPLRILPAAAAVVERMWLCGDPDPRRDEVMAMLDRYDMAGLEWARGDLAIWLQRLDPTLDLGHLTVAEAQQLQLSGQHTAAASAWENLDLPYEQALALVETRDEKQVRRGLKLLDHLGADAVAAKLRRDLRKGGMSHITSRARKTTMTNKAGLTAREVEVLALLDESLSNAQIAARLYISPKTADHHVSAILSKLQVASRHQAVDTGRQLGILT